MSAADTKKTPPSWFLSVEGDRLTVKIDRLPLGEVLAELARQTGLRVSVPPSEEKKVISRAFRDLPLDEGIDRLLAGNSHALLYEDRQSAGASAVKKIREIVVLSEEASSSSQRAEGPKPSDAKQESVQPVDVMAPVSAALQDSDPTVRLKGLEEWARRPERSVELLSQALVDEDESVRKRAQELMEQVLAPKPKGQ